MAEERKLVLRYTSGSKAGHVEERALGEPMQISFGRDPSSDVRFDDSDDLVSRHHAKLKIGDGDPPELEVTDLGSSNGTFVNKQRVSDSMRVHAGDVVQFGAGGPEFRLELDPAPEAGAKPTRLAQPAAAPTRLATEAPAAAAGVGKATVERMITDTKTQSRKQVLTLGAVAVAVLAAIVLVMLFQSRKIRQEVGEATSETQVALEEIRSEAPLQPSVIAAANTPSVVRIEGGWRLVDSRSGEQMYHRYRSGLPAYVYLRHDGGETIQPLLWESSERGTNDPIGSHGGWGSGFVVKDDGYILTNLHVAANWNYPYPLPLPGRLFDAQGNELGLLSRSGGLPVLENASGAAALSPDLLAGIDNWVPSQVIGIVEGSYREMEGRLDYLDVVFPKTQQRIPARIIRTSDRADAALIKIDLPTPVRPVEMYDSYATAAAGQEVTVMGYPAVSREVAVRTPSVDLLARRDEWKTVPDPTVTPGGIGRIYRAGTRPEGGVQYVSLAGDLYQLTINATGQGNSGGPVFDEYGRVVAIFTYLLQGGGASVTAAVPIKYGMELMELQPVVR